MIDIDFLQKQEVVEFIQNNENADTHQLLLNPPKEFRDKINLIADQVSARKKAKGKLKEWVADPALIFPPPISIEQASSSATADYKKSLVEGELLIDLTGGTGIDCLELSDTFKKSIYVEQNRDLCKVFSHNQKHLGREIEIHCEDAESFLSSFDRRATFFIDPARRDTAKSKVFKLEDCTPNVLELMPELAKKSNELLMKLSPLLDIKDSLRKISNVKEVHVVSSRNECKEVLLLLDFNSTNTPSIHAVNLGSGQQPYLFDFEKEAHSNVSFGKVSNYLFEPNASVLKAGAFKSIAADFNLQKIAPSTHLYTASSKVQAFPGRVFEIESMDGKKELAKYAPNKAINVITRNYPMQASDLKKKFRLKDGGDYFLIGFRDNQNKPHLVITRRIQ